MRHWSLLLAALVLSGSAAPIHTGRHLHLLRSDPAANDTVHVAPHAVRLWFSQRPELAITSIKLATAGGAAVALSAVTRDTSADAPVVAAVAGAVAPGSYVVTWRTTAMDGHPATGQIPFVVAR